MQITSFAPLRSVFAAVLPFHASPDVVAKMVPANGNRRERVTRQEMLNLFGPELRGEKN